jgi:metallo-beta-lactamase class B
MAQGRGAGPQDKPFPPHKVIGNIYYVGTDLHSSFLITTPQGHILINSTYDSTVPIVRKSVEQLGFRFEDIKILLGSHAHNDHMEGDALVKELTGAQVMAMDRDVPALERMRPGGKSHPIDRVLHHLEQVSLGGTTLVAHLTPGHTQGSTTWTLKAQEGGKTYDVVIMGGLGAANARLVNNTEYPKIAEDYVASYKYSRGLPCDVPLGSHPDHYRMTEKYPNIGNGSNPFIDPKGCGRQLDNWEGEFRSRLEEQRKAATR